MATCSICKNGCRGRCAKCGKPLCAKCMPRYPQVRCQFCPGASQARKPSMKKQTNVPHWRTNQAQPQSITQYYTPSPRFDSMDADQLSAFIEHKIKWLQDKQKREAAYLDRRARRGTHTPTDEAYGKDQTEETELLAFLEHWKASLEKVEE